jgi:glycosyltransferase involved in cell wall biosynthesis
MLKKERPDILMLGGFSIPGNYLAYRWAKRHGCKVIVQTERSRYIATGVPRPNDWKWKLLRFLYRDVDMVMTTAADIVPQFRDTFKFGEKVVAGQYPSDIDRYYSHPVRKRKDAYTLIFPNRMTDIYNPLGAIEIFAEVVKRYPKTRLKMNASGELRDAVEDKIRELRINDKVEFLDNIKTWDDLGEIYKQCDIMFLPAKFSNGNYTISECQVSGMGCVISDRILGEAPDVIKKFGAGFIVPLRNQAFVEKICWYIEHPELFAQEAEINRIAYKPATLAGTAELFYKLMGDM